MEVSQPPIHLISFTKSVMALLAAWPALQISFDQSSGYQSFNQQNTARAELATEIIGAFLDAQADSHDSVQMRSDGTIKLPDQEDLEDFLLSWVFGTLDVRLEDESEILVTNDLIGLWKEWSRMRTAEDEESVRQSGETIMKVQRMADAYQSNKLKHKTQVVEQGNSSDGEEGEDDDVMDVDQDSGSKKGRESPIIDEDGFTLVTKSTKRR
ncbi:hypothetical protein BY996DRAFT_4578390 [Phakopsora pachyrhizi]|uniref:Pre-rRNA-processing protein TSR2 n=1 Tax=Phakopsora pachyrhizi TaxID=170000 RepID=A0AAV0B4P0_PHAPC|nr:hypothetical protein BY996DRAFT_4578390 [Phakopsora pachyrhizi]CAH7681674.1 hypothetical protein PPACK8108_LOCUS14310 [Phakopsora pachyrhizi]